MRLVIVGVGFPLVGRDVAEPRALQSTAHILTRRALAPPPPAHRCRVANAGARGGNEAAHERQSPPDVITRRSVRAET